MFALKLVLVWSEHNTSIHEKLWFRPTNHANSKSKVGIF